MSDKFARSMTVFFKFIADTFFRNRYAHRAIVLETVAAVPGMVAGMWIHFESLRTLNRGCGTRIHEMLEEAENERKHLIFFLHVAKPNWLERIIIVVAQVIFTIFYTVMYAFFPGTAHRMVAYFEEEAVNSYSEYLKKIETYQIVDSPAPMLAVEYYGLEEYATLADMIRCIRRDEQRHSENNHRFADELLK